MINKKLLSFDRAALRYVGANVAFQWLPAQLQKVLRLAGIPCTENIEKENAQ